MFGSIGSISLAYSLNEILDHVLKECCTERAVSSFRSYLRKSKYCEGDRRPIVVLDWTLNGVGTSWVEWGVSGPGHLTPGWEAQCTGNVTAGTDSAGIALSLKRTFCICPKNTLVWAHSCQGSLSSYPKISHDVTFRLVRYLFVRQNAFPSCQMMVIRICWEGFEVTHHKVALKQTMLIFFYFFQRSPFSSVFIVYREKLSQLLLQLPWTGKQTIRSYGLTPIQALSLTCFLPWFPETPCITFVCKSIFLHCPSGVWSKKARLKENISGVVFLGSVNRKYVKFGRNSW